MAAEKISRTEWLYQVTGLKAVPSSTKPPAFEGKTVPQIRAHGRGVGYQAANRRKRRVEAMEGRWRRRDQRMFRKSLPALLETESFRQFERDCSREGIGMAGDLP